VTTCSATGWFLSGANPPFCSNFKINNVYPFTVLFTQNGTTVTGQVFLGTNQFNQVAATIAQDGHVTLATSLSASSGPIINTVWNINQTTAGQLSGPAHQQWIASNPFGTGDVDTTIRDSTKTASAGRSPTIVANDFEGLLRGMRGQ